MKFRLGEADAELETTTPVLKHLSKIKYVAGLKAIGRKRPLDGCVDVAKGDCGRCPEPERGGRDIERVNACVARGSGTE
jgi:hypothetical protein